MAIVAGILTRFGIGFSLAFLSTVLFTAGMPIGGSLVALLLPMYIFGLDKLILF